MGEGRGAAEGSRVRVVYCGGCNPHIDRSAVAAQLPLDDPDVPEGATVHLSGCPRACASGHALVPARRQEGAPTPRADDDPATVVVAGELVDGVPTPAPAIAAAVIRKLKE